MPCPSISFTPIKTKKILSYDKNRKKKTDNGTQAENRVAKKTEEGEGAVTVMPEPRPFFCCGDDKGDYNGGDDRLQGAGEERGREDGGREQPVLLLRLPQDWMSHRRCCRCIHHQRWRSCSLCFRGSLSFDHFYLLLFMQFIDVFVHVFTIYLRLFIYQATRLRDALSTAEVETWASRCFPADLITWRKFTFRSER